jgi:hypothetical protein
MPGGMRSTAATSLGDMLCSCKTEMFRSMAITRSTAGPITPTSRPSSWVKVRETGSFGTANNFKSTLRWPRRLPTPIKACWWRSSPVCSRSGMESPRLRLTRLVKPSTRAAPSTRGGLLVRSRESTTFRRWAPICRAPTGTGLTFKLLIPFPMPSRNLFDRQGAINKPGETRADRRKGCARTVAKTA